MPPSPGTRCTPSPRTGTPQGTSHLLPPSVLGFHPNTSTPASAAEIGVTPGHPFGLSKRLESSLLTQAFSSIPPLAPCISSRGGEGSSKGHLSFKGKEGGMSGGPLRSICRPLAEAEPPCLRLEPLHRWVQELGVGGAGQDAQPGVLESPLRRTPCPWHGWPCRDAAAAPSQRHTGTEKGCSCCAKALAVEIPRDSLCVLEDALGSHRQRGRAGPHRPRGRDLGGFSCLPAGMGEASLPGTARQRAGDPGGPGDLQGDPTGTPPAHPVPISQRFHAQKL